MESIGFDGYTIVMPKLENAHVVHYIGGLRLPVSFAALGDFKDTLDLLCLLKHHQLRLKKTIKPIHYRLKSAAPHGRYRITLEPEESAPKIFFTSIKKRDKRTPTAQANDDSSSDSNGEPVLLQR